jgi:hypothetical protein
MIPTKSPLAYHSHPHPPLGQIGPGKPENADEEEGNVGLRMGGKNGGWYGAKIGKFADELDLWMQPNTPATVDLFLDVANQPIDIFGPGLPQIQDKVSVTLGHLSIANAIALQSSLLDQASSGVGEGVPKYTTAVGPVVGLSRSSSVEAS